MISIERSLRHMAWANQQVFNAVMELPWNALGSYVSNPEWIAGRIMYHIVEGGTWFVHCLGIQHWDELPIPESMDDMRALSAKLGEYDALMVAAAELDDELLTFADEDGPRQAWRSMLLAQAVHHATEHRAQLIDALEARGHSPIALDDVDLWHFARVDR